MAAPEQTTEGRRYAGVPAADRRRDRRERLIEAGLELFGTQGYAAVSVKAICQQAGLTERYFYESFSDREGLLYAVYEHVVEAVAELALAAAREHSDPAAAARAGLDVFARALADDPRKARVQLLEVVGVSDALERRRREAMHAYARFIEQHARASGLRELPGVDPYLVSLGLVGATNELMIEWTLGSVALPIERLVDQCTLLFLVAAGASPGDAARAVASA